VKTITTAGGEATTLPTTAAATTRTTALAATTETTAVSTQVQEH
jgi:hypothetical protein